MDSYRLGYICGRIFTRITIVYTGARASVNTFRMVDKVANIDKINSNNPDAVTKNLFDCLEYIDW